MGIRGQQLGHDRLLRISPGCIYGACAQMLLDTCAAQNLDGPSRHLTVAMADEAVNAVFDELH